MSKVIKNEDKQLIRALETLETYHQEQVKKIEKDLGAKKMTRKWAVIFAVFVSWILIENLLSGFSNDYLVSFTIFGAVGGAVYFIFNKYIEKTEYAQNQQLALETTDSMVQLIENVKKTDDLAHLDNPDNPEVIRDIVAALNHDNHDTKMIADRIIDKHYKVKKY